MRNDYHERETKYLVKQLSTLAKWQVLIYLLWLVFLNKWRDSLQWIEDRLPH